MVWNYSRSIRIPWSLNLNWVLPLAFTVLCIREVAYTTLTLRFSRGILSCCSLWILLYLHNHSFNVLCNSKTSFNITLTSLVEHGRYTILIEGYRFDTYTREHGTLVGKIAWTPKDCVSLSLSVKRFGNTITNTASSNKQTNKQSGPIYSNIIISLTRVFFRHLGTPKFIGPFALTSWIGHTAMTFLQTHSGVCTTICSITPIRLLLWLQRFAVSIATANHHWA